MSHVNKPAPGDAILNRYLPDVPPERREEARVLLFQIVAWQARIIAQETRRQAVDSRKSDAGDTMDFTPPIS
jgi:hypothetical protein